MGQYTYVIAFVSVFVPLIDLGLDHILIREIARHQQVASEYIGAALLLKLLIFIVAVPLGMGVTLLIGHDRPENWAIFLCFLGTLAFREIPTVVGCAVFLAYERMEFRAVITFLYQIVKFALTLLVVLFGGGLVPIFAAALVAEASQGILALRLMTRKFSPPRLTFNFSLWRHYVKEALPLGIAFAFNSYYFQIDILVLKYFRSTHETGLFSVPFRIITTLFSMLIPMIWVLLPHLTKAAKESITRLHEDGKGYLKAIAVVTGGIAVYLCIEARDLTINIFGSEFAESARILALISPVVISHAFLYFFDLTLTAVGRQKLVIVGSSVIFGVKLIADLVFVPYYRFHIPGLGTYVFDYGIYGAAIGTLAADAACFAVMFYLTQKYVTSFNFIRIMFRPAGAVICAGLVLYLLRAWPFYITFVLFGPIYAFFIWWFKVISPNQRRFLKEMLQARLQKFGVSRNSNGSDNQQPR